MFEKEWIYTTRLWPVTALAVVMPALLAAIVVAGSGGRTALGEPLSIFYMSYVPFAAAFFRGMDRVRHEGSEGTGVVYLRTRVSASQLILTKWGFEAVLVILSLMPVTFVLAALNRLTGREVLFFLLAALTLTALGVVFSCAIISPSIYSSVALLLTLPPLVFSSETGSPFDGWVRLFTDIYPILVAFDGIGRISHRLPVPNLMFGLLFAQLAVLLLVAGRAYKWMLLRTLR